MKTSGERCATVVGVDILAPSETSERHRAAVLDAFNEWIH